MTYVEQTKQRLLEAITDHDGEWGWYQLERIPDYRKLPDGVTVMTMLKELEEEGLIETHTVYRLGHKDRIKRILDHYENQSEEEAIAEDEDREWTYHPNDDGEWLE